MKYINVEKLKKKIEELKLPFKKDIDDGVYPTYLCALLDFEELINSLQEEEPHSELYKKDYQKILDF